MNSTMTLQIPIGRLGQVEQIIVGLFFKNPIDQSLFVFKLKQSITFATILTSGLTFSYFFIEKLIYVKFLILARE